MEPTEAQCLVINALETLGLLLNSFYDGERGIWDIETFSSAMPIACLMPDGEIQPLETQRLCLRGSRNTRDLKNYLLIVDSGILQMVVTHKNQQGVMSI